MKRLWIIAFVAISGVGVAFAAGQEEQAEAKPFTLNFYHYATQTHRLYIDPLIAAFEEEYPNITIEPVEVSSGGYEALAQKVLLGLAAGTPPDVAQVGYSYLRTMADSGGAVSLDSFIASDPDFGKDELFPAMLQLGQVDGVQYLFPIGTSTPAMLVNMKLFEEFDLEIPTSWEDTRRAAEKLKAGGKLGVMWGWQVTGNWIFQAMIENAGGQMNSNNGTVPTFNSAAGLETLTYLADLTANGLMPVTDQGVATFVAGNLGMLIDSSFQRVNTPSQADFPVRLAPMPTPDGGPPLVPAGGNGAMMFAKGADRQAEAWKFIRFIGGERASRIVAESSGYTPANQAMINTLMQEYHNDENFRVSLDQAARVVPWHSWPGENATEIAQILKDMQEAVLLGRISPAQALLNAEAEVNALLK